MATSRNVERDRAIGARICLARIRAGMTRPALGRKLGINDRRVARYEAGTVSLPASMLQDLAAALTVEHRPCTPIWFLETDLTGVTEIQVYGHPEPGSVARRHFDHALAVLGGTVPPGGALPFGTAAAAAQHGSSAA